MPKISIVLPTRNQANYLSHSLDGIANQTFRDFELIVVDDGSTDSTPQVLADYQSRLGFELLRQAHAGLPTALNVGFAQAQGTHLTWTSSDNIMLPSMLETLSAALDGNPEVGMVYSDWYDIGDAGEIIRAVRTLDYDPLVLLRHNYIRASFMYRRQCRDEVGDYDPDMKYKEDHDYWLRIARRWPMKRVPEPLYQYRLHSRSLSSARGEADLERDRANRLFHARHRAPQPLRWWYAQQKWRGVKLAYMLRGRGREIPR
jgi:glycosyltransferase involved in cell wall biosynthesis